MNTIKSLSVFLAIVLLCGCQQTPSSENPSSEKPAVEQAVTDSVQ
jgi:uncharacterized lipoprotein YajG